MSGDISSRLKGRAGQRYDSAYPPSREFPNSPSGEHFKDFVQATLQERVRPGSFILWGLCWWGTASTLGDAYPRRFNHWNHLVGFEPFF